MLELARQMPDNRFDHIPLRVAGLGACKSAQRHHSHAEFSDELIEAEGAAFVRAPADGPFQEGDVPGRGRGHSTLVHCQKIGVSP